MERLFLKTFALVAFCLAAEVVSANAAMKAVYLEKKFVPGAFDESNSEAALKLYRKMGYNTIFEFIAPPTTGWDKSNPLSWTIKTDPTAEMDRPWLVNYISAQKARVKALGMEYSPLYSTWGWGVGEVRISDRARAAVYRDVPVYGTYDANIYTGLSKTVDGWGAGTVNWNGGTLAATLTIGTGAGNTTAATVYFTRGASSNSQVLTTGQPFRLKATITPYSTNPLKAGDRITVLLYQEFVVKPDRAILPLGLHLHPNPANKLLPQTKVEYLITKTYPGGGYDVYSQTLDAISPSTKGVVCTNCTAFDAKIDIWVEDATTLGVGHSFSNLIVWETSITTGESRAVSSIATVSGLEVTRVNPTTRLAYPDWETNYANQYPEGSNYNMRAIAKYVSPMGQTVQGPYFDAGAPPSPPWFMTNISGHFLPTSEGHGAPLIRLSIDPLSPAHDLIAKEMLKIIKEGLGGVEPKYYYLGGDEVFVFRRDNASRLGAPNSIYGSVSDGEFYARIIEKEMNRYKEVFTPNGTPTAKFAVSADMFVPTGDGFGIYADSHSDQSALAYWQQKGLQNVIQPNVWIYEEMRVPGGSTLLLENASEVQKSLTPLTNRGFRYSIWYSSYGKLSDIQQWKPQVVTDDDHLQHEIAMARNWFTIVQSSGNKQNFEGFCYAGWYTNVRLNAWNGLYPMAYFGGIAPSASDLPASWKAKAPNLDINGQPVLKLLMKNAWPPVDAQPAIRSLLPD